MSGRVFLSTLGRKVLGASLLRKAVSDSNYYFLSQLGLRLMSILIVPVLARNVSMTALGQYDLFLVFVSFLTTIVGLGIDSGMSIFIAKNQENEKLQSSLYTFSFWISVSLVLLLWLFFLGMAYWGRKLSLVPQGLLLHLAFCYLLITYINYLAFNFLRWKGQSKPAALSGFLSSATGLIGGIVAFYIGNYSIEMYLLGLTAGTAFSLPYTFWLTRHYLKATIPAEHRREALQLLRVSLPFVPNYIGNNLMLMTDRFLITHLLGLEALGQYALLSRFAQIPNFAVNIVTKGFQPVMFLNYETPQGRKLNRQVYHGFLLLLVCAVILCMFGAKWLVHLFGGAQYVQVAYLLPAVVITTLIYGGMGINGMGFTIKGKTLYLVFISFGVVAINACANYFSIGLLGLKGIAIGAVFAAGAGAFVYTWLSEKLHSFGLNLWLTVLAYVLVLILSFVFSFYS